MVHDDIARVGLGAPGVMPPLTYNCSPRTQRYVEAVVGLRLIPEMRMATARGSDLAVLRDADVVVPQIWLPPPPGSLESAGASRNTA